MNDIVGRITQLHDALQTKGLQTVLLKSALRECVETLNSSVVAIDDWLNTYAPELCNKDRVEQARKRIFEVGTLAYIADIQLKNRAAIKQAKELL